MCWWGLISKGGDESPMWLRREHVQPRREQAPYFRSWQFVAWALGIRFGVRAKIASHRTALEQSNDGSQHETKKNSQGDRYNDLTTEIEQHNNYGSEDRCCYRAEKPN